MKKNVNAELEEEVANVELCVSGEIPKWLSGTLVRNGPTTVTVNGEHNTHWFDGLAMLHAFSFDHGSVKYTNKFLRTDAYKAVFKKGSLDYTGFASDPCKSLFKRFFTLLIPSIHTPLHNANVNVAKIADTYVALTEIPLPISFDLKTLDTLGVLDYKDHLPKKQCWESAHPHVKDKTYINYLIKYGPTSTYTFYKIDEDCSDRKIIAEVPVKNPSYMHSFAITDNYVILTAFPLTVKPLELMTKGMAFIKNFSWHPEIGTEFIVINRHTGHVVKRATTRPFFSFHHANAYEESDKIHLDIVTYEDASIITKGALNVDAMSHSQEIFPTRLERFTLTLERDEISSKVLFSDKITEFPRINEAFDGNDYRFVYLAGFEILKENALYKFDTKTKEVLTWQEEGASPGEPIFIATPQSTIEDDGIIVSVVINQTNNQSFLLVLDAKTFKELGRATTPHLIPTGLHAKHFS